jgi:hypothetical protein
VGGELEWTEELASERSLEDGLPIACASATNLSGIAAKVAAVPRTRCAP